MAVLVIVITRTNMPTAAEKIQSLIKDVHLAYSYEKKASHQLINLKSDGHHFRVKQGLVLEAEENQRQCQRLEALLELLKPMQQNVPDEEELMKCYGQSLDLFDRFCLRHRAIGYDTSILVAEVMGRTDIMKTLEFCMKNRITAAFGNAEPIVCL